MGRQERLSFGEQEGKTAVGRPVCWDVLGQAPNFASAQERGRADRLQFCLQDRQWQRIYHRIYFGHPPRPLFCMLEVNMVKRFCRFGQRRRKGPAAVSPEVGYIFFICLFISFCVKAINK